MALLALRGPLLVIATDEAKLSSADAAAAPDCVDDSADGDPPGRSRGYAHRCPEHVAAAKRVHSDALSQYCLLTNLPLAGALVSGMIDAMQWPDSECLRKSVQVLARIFEIWPVGGVVVVGGDRLPASHDHKSCVFNVATA